MPGNWISEQGLWTRWSHRGILSAVEDSVVFNLDTNVFQEIVNAFEQASFDPGQYATDFVDKMNTTEEDVTDLPLVDAASSWRGDREAVISNRGSGDSKVHVIQEGQRDSEEQHRTATAEVVEQDDADDEGMRDTAPTSQYGSGKKNYTEDPVSSASPSAKPSTNEDLDALLSSLASAGGLVDPYQPTAQSQDSMMDENRQAPSTNGNSRPQIRKPNKT